MPRPRKLFGEKDGDSSGREWDPVLTPHNFSPTSGPPWRLRPSPAPRSAVPRPRQAPARTLRTAPKPAGTGGGVLRPGATRSRRPRASPSSRGAAGSAPFLTDPNMASAAARDDDTSPRRRRPGDRGGKRRKVSLLLSRPARDRRTTNLELHLPSRARAAATAAKVRLLLVPGAGRGLCPLLRPSLPGCV